MDQALGCRSLQHVSARAGLQSLAEVATLLVLGEHDDSHGGALLRKSPGQNDSIHLRERNIDDGDLRRYGANRIKRLSAARGLPCQFQILLAVYDHPDAG